MGAVMTSLIHVRNAEDLAVICAGLTREDILYTVVPGRGHGVYEVSVEGDLRRDLVPVADPGLPDPSWSTSATEGTCVDCGRSELARPAGDDLAKDIHGALICRACRDAAAEGAADRAAKKGGRG
jgi:hypothetical protein